MKNIITLLLTGLTLASCSSYLNKTPLDIISDDDVWNDVSLTEAYLIELYQRMVYLDNDCTNGRGWNGDGYWYVFGVNEVSDECMGQWKDWGEVLGWYNYKFGNLKIGGGLMDWWGYNPIRDMNFYIGKLPETPLSDELKARRMAEARYLRAFSYFAMVKRYGGVPLITEVQDIDTTPYEELYPKRNREQEVYDFIISEIDRIADDLPEYADAADLGRATRYAALALKCRAALYAASIAQFGKVELDGVVGIPAEMVDHYYRIAYDAADEIITKSNHDLYRADADKVTNFRNIFLVKNHCEVIFARHHNSINGLDGGGGWCVDFFQCPRPQGWSRGNFSGAYLEMVEAFDYVDGTSGKLDRDAIQQGLWTVEELWGDKDPRFHASLYTQETPWKGTTVDFHKGILLPNGEIVTNDSYDGIMANGDQDVDGTCFGMLKYLDESHDNMAGTNSAWATSEQDWLVFRYAEILLNFAEAAYELGLTGDALWAVNELRDRAGVALHVTIDREKIRRERKVELLFEGHRYWDARRWRIATEAFTGTFSGLRYVLDYQSYTAGTPRYKLMVVENIDGYVDTPLFREENYYLPITLARTTNNPNLVENPGYE